MLQEVIKLSDARGRERRRNRRFRKPGLVFAFDGRYHLAVDWSLGGALLSAEGR